jgi:hypothetical protein
LRRAFRSTNSDEIVVAYIVWSPLFFELRSITDSLLCCVNGVTMRQDAEGILI